MLDQEQAETLKTLVSEARTTNKLLTVILTLIIVMYFLTYVIPVVIYFFSEPLPPGAP
ncbi:MAG: hypothetical protein ABGW78_08220 [Pirellulales bacterium]